MKYLLKNHRAYNTIFALVICLVTLFNSSVVNADIPPISQNDLNSINNDTPFYNALAQSCASSGTGTSITTTALIVGNKPSQEVFNYFRNQAGLTDIQTAAVVGNLYWESHLVPTIMEKGGTSKNPADADPKGWGLAQWTPGSKVLQIAQSVGATGPIYSLSTQLYIVLQEMKGTAPTGYPNVLGGLKKITNTDPSKLLAADVVFFQKKFESGTDTADRLASAHTILKQDSGSTTGSSGSASSTTSNCSTTTTSYITCNNASAASTGITVSTAGLSTVRQAVVQNALCELALWKSKPGYPNPSFSATGFLKYTDGWYEEWCADFASWIYNKSGYPFSGGIAGGWMLAAVREIQALGEQGVNNKFHWHPASSGYIPKPGDLAIHGTAHVNIFITSTGKGSHIISTYIGGDQGSGPYGHQPALAPGSPTPNPPSASNVSTDTEHGYYSAGITGYVSPD